MHLKVLLLALVAMVGLTQASVIVKDLSEDTTVEEIVPDDTEEEMVATPYDSDFYGLDEEEDEDGCLTCALIEEIIDEVNDEDDPDYTPDDEDEISAEDGEQVGRGPRGRGQGRGKGRGRKEWKKGKFGRRGEDGATRRRGRGWRGHSGGDVTKKLAHVCVRLAAKEDTVSMHSKKWRRFTEEAREERARQWTETRAEMKVCCEMENDDDKVGCFEAIQSRKMSEHMCDAEASDFKTGTLPEPMRQAQDECCSQQGSERYECLRDAKKTMKKQMRKQMRTPKTPEEKVTSVCERVSKKLVPRGLLRHDDLPITQKRRWVAIFTSRRLQMQECCALESEDRATCLSDVHEQRLDRVCRGEEPLSPPWSRRGRRGADDSAADPVLEVCCRLEDEDRYSCFEEKLPGRQRGGGKRQHRKGKKHWRGGRTQDASEEDQVDTEQGTPEPYKEDGDEVTGMRRRFTKGQKGRRREKRQCCRKGREAGALLGEEAGSRWQTCNNEAQGFMLAEEVQVPAVRGYCKRSFRRCCVNLAIKNAGEQAIEEAEMEEDTDVTVEE
jgi:hypothetical protein